MIGLPPQTRVKGVGRHNKGTSKSKGNIGGGPTETEKYYDLRKRTRIYEVDDVVLKKNSAGVVGSSKKLNPVMETYMGSK